MLACESTPCPTYVSAFNECYEINDPSSNNRLPGGFCTDYDETSDAYFTCLADSYSDGDCSTDTGLAAIDVAIASCTL
jgi:hypothetical protein